MTSIFDVLTSLGYHLHDRGDFWRARAIFRPSRNETSLSINKSTGWFTDFGTSSTGSFKDLIKLTISTDDDEAVKQLLAKLKYESDEIIIRQPKLKIPQTFDTSLVTDLLPHYSYWAGRGISKETLDLFGGGVAGAGKMLRRYVFPIFNETQTGILGFAGRDLTGKKVDDKWKLLGLKKGWAYPLFLSLPHIITKREVILVESIGDMLALWEAGIYNVLVLFGVALTSKFALFSRLVSLNPRRIILALNNDTENKKNNGQESAAAIKSALTMIFDRRQIDLAPPPYNDFGLTPTEEIQLWYAATHDRNP